MIRRPPLAGSPPDLDLILAAACRTAGIRMGRFRLLRHFANAVYLVEEPPVVVRLGYSPGSVERSARALAVTAWLAARGLPVTEPATVPSGASQPIIISRGGREVAATFWRYYPQPDPHYHRPDPSPLPGFAILASIARALHEVTAAPPVPLPGYQPLRSLTVAVEAAQRGDTGDPAILDWLARRIAELRDAYQDLTFPLGSGLIHADLHTGNLFSAGAGSAVLGDWDSVCRGPREIDLIPIYAAVRFGLDSVSVDQFAACYGYDLRGGSGFRPLLTIRDFSTLTALVRLAPTDPAMAGELRHRVDSLRGQDDTVIWIAR